MPHAVVGGGHRAVTVGPVPVRPAPLAVISGWSVRGQRAAEEHVDDRRAGVAGPPLVWMLLAPMFDSASSAASICAPVALYGIGAVVWPLKVSVNVPPVALVVRTVCCSSVS